jgi:hypothetical protein
LLKQFIDKIPLKMKNARKKRVNPNGMADPVS